MADNTLQITPPFKYEIKTPPRGMTDYDPSAIHPQQQEELNTLKVNLMKENVIYMAKHPEVCCKYCTSLNRAFYVTINVAGESTVHLGSELHLVIETVGCPQEVRRHVRNSGQAVPPRSN